MFFDKGLDVDEEFSHSGDDGAFVGLAPVAQTLDIGFNNGVAVSLRCERPYRGIGEPWRDRR